MGKLETLYLPIIFACIGFLISSKSWLLFLDSLNPAQGLAVYYFIVFVTISVLQYFGLVIGGQKMQSFRQTIGEILIIFSFFILFNFESQYVQWVVDKSKNNNASSASANCTTVYDQSEDGATYYIVNGITNSPEKSRYITFIAIPFILTLIGVMLVQEKIEIGVL
jgi:hypothetical protein